jgi:tRNA pseudouridine13 synthase
LRDGWGDWPRLQADLPKGHARRLVDYLFHHPGDFRGALEKLKPELRGLYLSAWQSHLWNKMLAHWLREHVSPGQLMSIRSRLGDLPVPRTMRAELLDEWQSLSLPLPSSRLKLDPAAPWAPLVEEVMKEEGLKLEEMKLKTFRKPFFSKGDRAAAVIPIDLSAKADEDELNPGKQKLILSFDLPRGCYATMIVKRLTQMKEG